MEWVHRKSFLACGEATAGERAAVFGLHSCRHRGQGLCQNWGLMASSMLVYTIPESAASGLQSAALWLTTAHRAGEVVCQVGSWSWKCHLWILVPGKSSLKFPGAFSFPGAASTQQQWTSASKVSSTFLWQSWGAECRAMALKPISDSD